MNSVLQTSFNWKQDIAVCLVMVYAMPLTLGYLDIDNKSFKIKLSLNARGQHE